MRMGFADGRKVTGLYTAEVVRSERVTPHMVRITFAGDDISRLPVRGFDQWFRLFLPREDGDTDFGAVPEQFGMGGYIKYLTSKSGTRPPVRSYTLRTHRPEIGELDVDFVAHGDEGIAGPWAQRAEPGQKVALIDQGRGFDLLDDADFVVLVGDESALPAIAGILRDLPVDASGLALIEIPTPADEQPLVVPTGFEVRWLPRGGSAASADSDVRAVSDMSAVSGVRAVSDVSVVSGNSAPPHKRVGALALAALRAYAPACPLTVQAYIAGEQSLAAEGRRHLVAVGVPKGRVVFTGYWKAGREG
jgi:NADPH-dependent ferric siderophore reductase